MKRVLYPVEAGDSHFMGTANLLPKVASSTVDQILDSSGSMPERTRCPCARLESALPPSHIPPTPLQITPARNLLASLKGEPGGVSPVAAQGAQGPGDELDARVVHVPEVNVFVGDLQLALAVDVQVGAGQKEDVKPICKERRHGQDQQPSLLTARLDHNIIYLFILGPGVANSSFYLVPVWLLSSPTKAGDSSFAGQ